MEGLFVPSFFHACFLPGIFNDFNQFFMSRLENLKTELAIVESEIRQLCKSKSHSYDHCSAINKLVIRQKNIYCNINQEMQRKTKEALHS